MRIGRRTSPIIAAAGLLLVPAHSAFAQNVPMGANVTGPGCSIQIEQPGTLLAINGDTRFSSDTPGGQAGIATVNTDGRYRLSIVNPTSWTSSPIPGNATTTFTSRFRGININGNGVNFNWRTQNQSRMTRPNRNGVTEIQIHLTGDYQAGVFPGGTYNAEVTLLCE